MSAHKKSKKCSCKIRDVNLLCGLGLLNKIPKYFDFFGYKISVIAIPDNIMDIEMSTETDAFYDPFQHVIAIRESLEGMDLLASFCHEFFELANDKCSLDLPHSAIETLGNVMAQMLITGGKK